ncbi:hypothetical protein NKI25_08050 [Mesorhizobium sp. M0808]|uniref:hypothetical protein n=1 Tax=Mesorhizobium sp. M0808 TaxID=2957002 RepID=UPI00333D1A7C
MPANNVVPLRQPANAGLANDNADQPLVGFTLYFDPDDPALANLLARPLEPSAKSTTIKGKVALSYCFSDGEEIEELCAALEPGEDDDYLLIKIVPKVAQSEARDRLYTVAVVRDGLFPAEVDEPELSAESALVGSVGSLDAGPTEMINDAEVYGEISDAIWRKKLFVSTAKKREDKFFKVSPELSFSDILVSNLSKIRVGVKDGACLVPGVLVDGRRLNQAVTKLYMMGLDVDSGASMEDTMRKLQTMGLFFVAYTTHSHGTTTLGVKKDKFFKWADDNGHPTEASVETVKLFLANEGKYTEDVIASVSNVNTSHETSGIQLIITTRPIDKFRLLFILEQPYVIAEQEGAQKDAIRAWGDMILGMGSLLGISVDRAARDCSRLFYLPSKAKGSTSARVIVSAGRALDWRSLPRVTVTGTVSSDPFDQAASIMGGKIRGQILSPQKGLHLQKWASERAHGFQISSVFKDHCDDRIRVETGPGKYTVECPFDDDHSNAGDPDDPGCFIQDAGMDAESFTFRCSHDSCAGHDRLAMLEKAMVDGWFTDDVLTDPAYDISGADEEEEGEETTAEEQPPQEEAEEEVIEGGTATTADIARAMDLANKAVVGMASDKISAILKQLLPMGQFDRVRIIKLLAMKAKIPAAQLESLFKAIELKASPIVDDKPFDPAKTAKQFKKRFKSLHNEKRPIVVPSDDHEVASLRHLLHELDRANRGDEAAGIKPAHTLFDFGGNKVRISKDTNGKRVIKDLSRATMRNAASELLCVCKMIDSNTQTEAFLSDLMSDQLIVDPRLPLLPLSQFSNHPVFDRDGNLLRETGYNPPTGRYINLDGLDLSKIKKHYNDVEWADVEKAVAALWRVFGDFRWMGYADDDGGAGARMSYAHYIALLITPLIREIITKNVMLFGIDKPDAASGGTLLGKCASILLAGTAPDQLQWPRGRDADDELGKRLIGALKRSPAVLVIDNVHGVIAGSLIASLATGRVSLRPTHSVDLFDGELRCPAVFIGNGLAWSDENARRVLPIRIDPTEADEGGNKNFKVKEALDDYLLKNRSEFLGHLITIVQWWFKQGRPLAAKTVESFEEFVSIMSGILKAAGIPGWLEGLDAFTSNTKKSQSDEIGILQTLAKEFKFDTESTTEFVMETTIPHLFKELEGGTSSYTRYEARFAHLAGCVQNGSVSLLSLAKTLGYLKGKPRKIEHEGETVKVRLTKRDSDGKHLWKIVRVT